MRRRITLLPMTASFAVGIILTAAGLAPTPVAAQRIPTDDFESLPNRISNVEMVHTNFGAIGHGYEGSLPGGHWPRGSRRSYLYGGGLWFGARKRFAGELRGTAVIGYNPNSGASWFRPGIAGDSLRSPNLFRLYRASEYNPATGEPLDSLDRRTDGARWPIWNSTPARSLGFDGYAGNYIYDTNARTTARYGAPVFVSDEDITAIYTDDDLARYEAQQERWHPIGVQVEEVSYSWNNGPLRDIVVARYRIINVSRDTLFDAFIAMALDFDIGHPGNDHTSIVIPDRADDSLDLAVAWSEGEPTGRYGYVGLDVVESPERDEDGFIRARDGVTGHYDELGLTTFRNWNLAIDPGWDGERYDFIASGNRDGDDFPGDKRQLIATGPFAMRPGDTATAAFAIIFAMNTGSGSPTGTWADMASLIELDRTVQLYYDAMFKLGAPIVSAPDEDVEHSSRSIFITPSPADGSGRVHATFSVEATSDATLRVVDPRGITVRESHLGTIPQGSHRVPIAIENLPAGFYIVSVEAGEKHLRGHLIVQR